MAGFFFTSENNTKLEQFIIFNFFKFPIRIPPRGINSSLLETFKRLNFIIPK